MCENYFGAFSLATIRRAFHYVSIHKKKQYRAPIQGSPIQRGKTEVLQTGAYISATKKTKIHTVKSRVLTRVYNKKIGFLGVF